MNLKASIIIPHYGEEVLLRRCLRAVAQTSDEYEVIVVDNGTGIDQVPAHLITNSENRGFAVACNQGAKAAKSDTLVFLNNDTTPTKGWLDSLLKGIDGTVAIVGCKLVYPNGTIQHSGVSIVRDSKGNLRGFNETRDLPRRRLQAVTAAAMAIRRTVFESVGGFDEAFWNSHEDVDLCLRVRQLGYDVLYEPAAVVQHVESAAGKQRRVGVSEARSHFNERWRDNAVEDRVADDRPGFRIRARNRWYRFMDRWTAR